MIDDTYMVGKISVKNHPFVEHFKFVKALEDENTVAKQTIPSPGQFYAYFTGTQLLEDTLKYTAQRKHLLRMSLRLTVSLSRNFMRLAAEICSLMTAYGVAW